MKKENINIIYFFVILFFCLSVSCSKLDPEVYDKVTKFWQNDDQIAAGVAPAYSSLRDYAPFNGIYILNEVSTDEIIVPNRGTDWGDDVVFEQMWKHTWRPNNQFINEAWQFIYGGIARLNLIQKAVNDLSPKPPDITAIIAELSTVRAFYYFLALDLFGNVPITDLENIDPSKLGNKPRNEVFAYVEKELKNNRAALTSELNPKTYGRVTNWFVHALLAKLYLNAQVYTGTSHWTDCILSCDQILNSYRYSLEPNFFDNFKILNEGSRENIFVIPSDINAGVGNFWLQVASLHYNSNATFDLKGAFGVGGFNGPCSTAEYLSFFDLNDIRRKMFLVGQQYTNSIQYITSVADPAHMQYDAFNYPLYFDPIIDSFKVLPPKTQGAGARCVKWELNKEESFNMSNDFAVFRLADIILMKAEAQYRNGDINGALVTMNRKTNEVSIRGRAGLRDFTSSEFNLDSLFKERTRELSWEGWRRNDMIRFGHYTDARIPEKALSGNYRNLFPIPEAEISKNPYLKQNPGY